MSTEKGTPNADTQLDAEGKDQASLKAQPIHPQGPYFPQVELWSLPVISRGLLNFLLNPCSPGIACKRRGAACHGEGDGKTEVPSKATTLKAAPWRPWFSPGLMLCHMH